MMESSHIESLGKETKVFETAVDLLQFFLTKSDDATSHFLSELVDAVQDHYEPTSPPQSPATSTGLVLRQIAALLTHPQLQTLNILTEMEEIVSGFLTDLFNLPDNDDVTDVGNRDLDYSIASTGEHLDNVVLQAYRQSLNSGHLSTETSNLTFYCRESHTSMLVNALTTLSIITNAQLTIRPIPNTLHSETMNVDVLVKSIHSDLNSGCTPILIIAAAGTATTNENDDIREIRRLAENCGSWVHVECGRWGEINAGEQDEDDEEKSNSSDGMLKIYSADSATFDMGKLLGGPLPRVTYIKSSSPISHHHEQLERVEAMLSLYTNILSHASPQEALISARSKIQPQDCLNKFKQQLEQCPHLCVLPATGSVVIVRCNASWLRKKETDQKWDHRLGSARNFCDFGTRWMFKLLAGTNEPTSFQLITFDNRVWIKFSPSLNLPNMEQMEQLAASLIKPAETFAFNARVLISLRSTLGANWSLIASHPQSLELNASEPIPLCSIRYIPSIAIPSTTDQPLSPLITNQLEILNQRLTEKMLAKYPLLFSAYTLSSSTQSSERRLALNILSESGISKYSKGSNELSSFVTLITEDLKLVTATLEHSPSFASSIETAIREGIQMAEKELNNGKSWGIWDWFGGTEETKTNERRTSKTFHIATGFVEVPIVKSPNRPGHEAIREDREEEEERVEMETKQPQPQALVVDTTEEEVDDATLYTRAKARSTHQHQRDDIDHVRNTHSSDSYDSDDSGNYDAFRLSTKEIEKRLAESTDETDDS